MSDELAAGGLVLSSSEHRPFFDQTSDPIGVFGRELMIRDANLAGGALLGTDRDAVIGRSLLSFAPGGFSKSFNDVVNRVLDTRTGCWFSTFFNGVYMHIFVLVPEACAAIGERDKELALGWGRRCVVSRQSCDGGEEMEEISFDAPYLGPLQTLTARELAVLRLVGLGMTSQQMGAALHRSPRTIESNIVSVGRKLDAATRVQQARLAIRYGLAGVDEDPETARLLDEGFFAELVRGRASGGRGGPRRRRG